MTNLKESRPTWTDAIKAIFTARGTLVAYAPGTEQGREALKSLSAEGLGRLRASVRLPHMPQLLLEKGWELLFGLGLGVALGAGGLALWSGNSQWLVGAGGFLVLVYFLGRVGESRESAILELQSLLLPIFSDGVACRKVIGLASSEPSAQAYRDAVVLRRELVDADLRAMEALEQLAQNAVAQEDLARLGRQAHGGPAEGITPESCVLPGHRGNSGLGFSLTTAERTQFEAWAATKPRSRSVDGAQFQFSFLPTNIGLICKVRCLVSGDELDLTDYDGW